MSDKPIEPFKWGLKSAAELIEEHRQWQREMEKIFTHCKRSNCITINVVYPYDIGLERIPDPEALLSWVWHLTEKDWMSTSLLNAFIERVYRIKGWDFNRFTMLG